MIPDTRRNVLSNPTSKEKILIMEKQNNKTILKQELKTICQELQEKMNIINNSTDEGHSNNPVEGNSTIYSS
jgi:hypothetical protein